MPLGSASPFFTLIRTNWPSQQRSPARARAAGLPATPLEVTAADVLAWDRDRGEPPLGHGFTPDQEQAVLARHDGAPGPEEGRETRPVRDNLDTS